MTRSLAVSRIRARSRSNSAIGVERSASLMSIRLPVAASAPARTAAPSRCTSTGTCRAPLATDRLSRREDGRLVYRLRHRWRDGTTHILYESLELIERLAALVRPPRFHLVRYDGLLAPRASWRDLVVPTPVRGVGVAELRVSCGSAPTKVTQSTIDAASGDISEGMRAPATSAGIRPGVTDDRMESDEQPAAPVEAPSRHTSAGAPHLRRLPWAQLLARVFLADALVCSRCGARMRILADIQAPDAIRSILECLGLPTRPPPLTPAAPSAFTYADA